MPESLNETLQRLGWAEDQAENFIEKAGGVPSDTPLSDTVLHHVRTAQTNLRDIIEEHDVGLLIAQGEPPPPGSDEPPETQSPTLGLGGGANEPGGMSKILEWDLGWDFPPHHTPSDTSLCASVEGLDGVANRDVAGGGSEIRELYKVEDASAPLSGPQIMYQKYPDGHSGESHPDKMWFWKDGVDHPCDVINHGEPEFNEVYLREFRKIHTDRADGTVETFQHGNGFKFGHLGGDKRSPKPRGFSLTIGVAGVRSSLPNFLPDFNLKVRNIWFDKDGGSNTEGRTSADRIIKVGTWHEIEWYVKVNTIAADGSANADGIIRGWVDGVLVINWEGVRMRSGFNSKTESKTQVADFTGTWSGGPDDTHTHDKGFYIDHIYISGKN